MRIMQLKEGDQHLVADLFDRYRVFYRQPSDSSGAERFIRERLAEKESVIFVVFDESGEERIPVGFTQLYPTYSSVQMSKNWILNDLYVAEDYRQKGIGENLIRTAMDFAAREGARFLQLETATGNKGARRLYETIGFVKQAPDTEFVLYRIPV